MYGPLPKGKFFVALWVSSVLGLSACGPKLKMIRGDEDKPAQAGDQQPQKRPNPAPVPVPGPSVIDISALPFKMAAIRQGAIGTDFVPFQSESSRALADAEKFAEAEQKFVRYLTLGYNEQIKYKDDQSRAKTKIEMIDSMSVLLNSLSTAPAIIKPVALGENMCLFRIDIRNYGWTAQQFEKVLKGTNLAAPKVYPYTVAADDNITQLKAKLGTDVPIVRADWFLFEAGKPQNYHDLLGIEDTLAKIEQRTQVKRIDNIKATMNFPQNTPLAVRAAIGRGKSGVSTNNRLIERHKASFGSFWLSYDFAAPSDTSQRDIFKSPLGPKATGDVGNLKGFTPAGGELIFNLANGLQAYALLDDADKRIDVAPTQVVFNPTDRNRAGAITNGYACWSCHSQGILAARDEMLPFIDTKLTAAERDRLFGKAATAAIKALHVPQKQLNALYSADSKTHNEAVVAARLVGDTPMAQMAWTAQYYEKNMTLAMVAAELDLSLSQLQDAFVRLPKELQASLQAAKNDDLDRGSFETLFPKLVNALFTQVSE